MIFKKSEKKPKEKREKKDDNNEFKPKEKREKKDKDDNNEYKPKDEKDQPKEPKERRNPNHGKDYKKPQRRAKNTTDFEPNHTPPDIRVYCADGTLEKFKNPSNTTVPIMNERDVILVTNMFKQEKPNEIYEKLLKEIGDAGNPEDIWKTWHGDSHTIANDHSHVKWKEQSPTFNMVIERMAQYFDMDVKATRFNWFKNSSDWKPFHHDAAAVDPKKAETQNFTVGISFGATREIVFQHAKNYTTVAFPLGDAVMYTFGKQINLDWKHGVPQIDPVMKNEEGRISIIAWGKNEQT